MTLLRNLKAQCRLYASGAASILLLLTLFIPYSLLLGSSYDNESFERSITYQVEVMMLIPVMIMLFAIMWSGVIGNLALSYGATRRGWYLAQAVLKLAASGVFCTLGLLVFLPLAKLFFGEVVVFDAHLLLPFFAVTWGLSAFGEFLGYIIAAKGARWMFIALGPLVAVLIFLVFFAISNEWVFLVSRLSLTIIGFAMVPVFQALAWLLYRRVAVR